MKHMRTIVLLLVVASAAIGVSASIALGFFMIYWACLVAGEKLWDQLRKVDPEFSCAKLFWWYNMYSTADVAVTPRPMYPADGRKLPGVYANPPELRDELNRLSTPFGRATSR